MWSWDTHLERDSRRKKQNGTNIIDVSMLRAPVSNLFFFIWSELIRTPVQLNTVFLSYAQVLKSFQVRKFHRTIGTNVLFTKVDFKDRDECFFCDSKHETIEHLFWCCDRILALWNALTNWTWKITKTELKFSPESVLYPNCLPCKNAINFIILVVEFFFV